MKRFGLVPIFILSIGWTSYAQSPLSKVSVGLFIAAGPSIEVDIKDTAVTTERNPKIIGGFNASFQINEHFSFTFLFSRQAIDLKVSNNVEVIETGQVNRTYLGFATYYHYKSEGKLSAFSGIKLGYTYDRPKKLVSHPDYPNYIAFQNGSIKPQLSLAPIGLRYQIKEKLSATAEINAGAPYIINLGIVRSF